DLDITSKSEIFGITVRQPIYRTLRQQVALELTGERESEETFLLGEPFSFSPGVHNGRSVVTALRLVVESVTRSEAQVVAARSRLSHGIDAVGATINSGPVPDGRFLAWLGQFQWVRRLDLFDSQVIFRTDVQLSRDPLLTLEQISVGGRYSVRGYRENQFIRD